MGISVIGGSASASGGGTNNFVLRVNSSTTYGLDRTYASGRYELVFSDNDTTFDIYAIAENGSYAGYTNNTVLEVSEDFSELVVLGGAPGARISFTHLGVISEAITSGDVAAAGAFINSVGTSSLPDIDDFTIVNGGNFAADVQVSFIGQDATETAAKTVVRSSSTQLLVTRPDSFSPDNSPYTVKVVNPGIPVPAGTNAHLLSNSVTAGTNPAWTTPTDIYYNVGGATSITLLATDTEGSDIDYSLISGTLPAGLTLDNETGVISGTFSGTANEGDITAITIRAIDTGGNFLDKAFNLAANTAPTWITPAGAIEDAALEGTYSFQLAASSGTIGGALAFALQAGTLPLGLSLSSSGLISGTNTEPSVTTNTFTVRVTDEGGLFADREFSIATVERLNISGGSVQTIGEYIYRTFTSSGTLTVNSGGGDLDYLIVAGGGSGGYRSSDWPGLGGGGAGGVARGTITNPSAGSYPIIIGAGGPQNTNNSHKNGSNSSAFGISAIGGGGGGSTTYGQAGANGGSGGGGSYAGQGGSGTANQGNSGGAGREITGSGFGGGGGGAGQPGNTNGAGRGGDGFTWVNNITYGGGGGGSADFSNGPAIAGGTGGGGASGNTSENGVAGTNGLGGGGGAAGREGYYGGAGGNGVVIVRYLA